VIDGVALLPHLQENLAASQNGTRAAHAGSIFHNSLALGVVLHRLPVGMALWWSVRPNFGTPAAVMTFALLIIATGLSYLFGAPVVELATTQSLALFQAFVAGSLVHVVAFGVSHRHAGDEAFVPADNWGFRAGILLGMFVVFALPRVF
jgi:zinc transporter ZupT